MAGERDLAAVDAESDVVKDRVIGKNLDLVADLVLQRVIFRFGRGCFELLFRDCLLATSRICDEKDSQDQGGVQLRAAYDQHVFESNKSGRSAPGMFRFVHQTTSLSGCEGAVSVSMGQGIPPIVLLQLGLLCRRDAS